VKKLALSKERRTDQDVLDASKLEVFQSLTSNLELYSTNVDLIERMSHESLRQRHWEQISNLTGLYGPGGAGESETGNCKSSSSFTGTPGSILIGRTYDELILVLAEKDTSVTAVIEMAMKEFRVRTLFLQVNVLFTDRF